MQKIHFNENYKYLGQVIFGFSLWWMYVNRNKQNNIENVKTHSENCYIFFYFLSMILNLFDIFELRKWTVESKYCLWFNPSIKKKKLYVHQAIMYTYLCTPSYYVHIIMHTKLLCTHIYGCTRKELINWRVTSIFFIFLLFPSIN